MLFVHLPQNKGVTTLYLTQRNEKDGNKHNVYIELTHSDLPQVSM